MNLRPRITYANVVSSLSLFIVLGGSAYAVTQIDPKSVGTKQLKNNAVRSGKIADGTIKRVDATQGAFATPPQLAGKLGVGATAANSAKLGNIGPNGFLKGGGRTIGAEFDITEPDDVLSVPGGGLVHVECDSDGYAVLFVAEANTWDVYSFRSVSGATPAVFHATRNPGDVQPFSAVKNPAVFQLDVESSAGPAAALTVFIHFDDTNDHCIGRVRGFSYASGL